MSYICIHVWVYHVLSRVRYFNIVSCICLLINCPVDYLHCLKAIIFTLS